MGTNGGLKPTEIPVSEFCCKSVNLSLEELKNIKTILCLIHELFRKPRHAKAQKFKRSQYAQQRERNCSNRSHHFSPLPQSLKNQILLKQIPPLHLNLFSSSDERVSGFYQLFVTIKLFILRCRVCKVFIMSQINLSPAVSLQMMVLYVQVVQRCACFLTPSPTTVHQPNHWKVILTLRDGDIPVSLAFFFPCLAPTISSAPNMFSHILLIQQIPVSIHHLLTYFL